MTTDPLANRANQLAGQVPLLLSAPNEELLKQVVQRVVELRWRDRDRSQARQFGRLPSSDLKIIETDEKTIKIEAIRELKAWAGRRGITGQKAAIIRQVEKLTLPAANALLKSLEDEAGQTCFILTTRWPARLLLTIRSRCYCWHLTKPEGSSRPGEKPRGKSEDRPEGRPSTLGSKVELIDLLTQQTELDEEWLVRLGNYLSAEINQQGPQPHLTRAVARWRDYYRLKASGGNLKIARDVLLATLLKM